MLSIEHKIFTNRTTRIRSEPLHRSRTRSSSSNNGCIFHSTRFSEFFSNRHDLRIFLSDSDVDTFHILSLLIENGIDCDLRLPSLSISDDKFSLSSSHWHECIDRLNTGRHRFMNPFSTHNSGCNTLGWVELRRDNRTKSIEWVSEWIDNTTKETISNGNFESTPCCFGNHSFLDSVYPGEYYYSDEILLEVHSNSTSSRFEFDNFVVGDFTKSYDFRDTVPKRDNNTGIHPFRRQVSRIDFRFDFTDKRVDEFCRHRKKLLVSSC